jgi:MFS family permease
MKSEPIADNNAGQDYPREAYAWYVVGVLVVAYTFSFIDRMILTLLVDPIRASLHISDVQIGLLHGLAFAIFYTTLGIPIARYADRLSRTRIISAGVLVWSFTTALCGFARNFGGMFLARIGVGVGEAALSPAGYSLLSDYFSPRKLPFALSVYQAAIFLGTGAALITGGAMIASVPAMTLPVVGYLEPWRVVFLVVGLPGILVVLLMRTVREPQRKGMLAGAKAGEAVSIRTVVSYVTDRRAAYGLLIGGFAIKSMIWNGVSAWIPTHFMRTFHWTPAQVGLWYGMAVIVFGMGGILAGGLVSARLRKRGQGSANVWPSVLATVGMLPTGVIAPLLPNPVASLAVYCLFIFSSSFPVGSFAAALQEITPNQMRAQISALYLFVSNLVALTLGPTLIAMLTQYAFQDATLIRYSMATFPAIVAPIAALLLWRALKPYLVALQNVRF